MATHGSLTKAGKVRGQTPKVEGRKIVGTNSKLRNKSNFRKRFVLAEIGLGGKMPGQNKASQKDEDAIRIQFIDAELKTSKTKWL